MRSKEYYIKDNKIYHYSNVISETQLFDNEFTYAESIIKYITENDCFIFICQHYNQLNLLKKNYIIDNWEAQFAYNISFEKEDGDLLCDYPKGYFYFVDCWLGIDNKIIFIFNINH